MKFWIKKTDEEKEITCLYPLEERDCVEEFLYDERVLYNGTYSYADEEEELTEEQFYELEWIFDMIELYFDQLADFNLTISEIGTDILRCELDEKAERLKNFIEKIVPCDKCGSALGFRPFYDDTYYDISTEEPLKAIDEDTNIDDVHESFYLECSEGDLCEDCAYVYLEGEEEEEYI